MNNKKCPNCGFINFVTAEACRKCETSLIADEAQYAYYEAPPPYRGGVNQYQQPYPTKKSVSTLRAIGYVFVGVLALGVISTWGVGYLKSHTRVNWIEYHPDGIDATIMMPNEPARHEPILTPMATGTMSNHSYVSVVAGQGTAMFCFVDYSGIVINKSIAPQALDAELNAFLSRTHSTLISKNPIDYQGMTGLEFEITPPENLGSKARRGYGKMFVSMSRLYFLSITAAEDTELFAGKDKFLNPKIAPSF